MHNTGHTDMGLLVMRKLCTTLLWIDGLDNSGFGGPLTQEKAVKPVLLWRLQRTARSTLQHLCSIMRWGEEDALA